MAAKQARPGLDYYIEVGGTDYTEFFISFDPGLSKKFVDATAGDDAVQSKVGIRMVCEPSGDILIEDGAAGLALQALLEEGNVTTLHWGARGNTTGYPKWGIDVEIEKGNIPMKHDDKQVISVVFANVGKAFLFDGRTDTW